MKNINAGIKNILVAGTCFEYGLVNGPIKSNTICNPTNMYAIGKNLLHKMLLLEKKKLSFNLLWTRIFYPYGENQKSGIVLSELQRFYNYCSKELSLNVVGLMCIPPMSSNSDNYFKLLKKTSDEFNLKELSMGMSSDFEQAVSNNATYLRLGTIILGERKST